jgi:hypothetical protein
MYLRSQKKYLDCVWNERAGETCEMSKDVLIFIHYDLIVFCVVVISDRDF